jgi:hypothetical protein
MDGVFCHHSNEEEVCRAVSCCGRALFGSFVCCLRGREEMDGG